MKKLIFTLLIILFVVSGISMFMLKPEIPSFDKNLLFDSGSRYVINSQENENYGKYPIYYPSVSVRPDSKKYALVSLYEKYQILTNQQSRLFFASKRVNEIATWINSLPILGNIDSFFQLRSSMVKNGTIESVLSAYMKLIDSESILIRRISDNSLQGSRLFELKRYLFQNKNTLLIAIHDSSVSENKRKYLFSLTELIFREYFKETNLNMTAPVPGIFIYPLSEIQTNFDYGYYNLYLDQKDVVPLRKENIISTIGNTKYKLQKVVNNPGLYGIENIQIGKNAKYFTIDANLTTAPELIFEKQSPLINPQIAFKIRGNRIVVTLNNISAKQKSILLNSLSNSFVLSSQRLISPGNYLLICESRTSAFIKKMLIILGLLTLLFVFFSMKISLRIAMIIKTEFSKIYFSQNTKVFFKIIEKQMEQKFRLILIFVGLLIFLDIILVRFIFDPLTLAIVLVLFVLAGFRKKSHLLYVFAMLLMIIAVLLYLSGFELASQKTADLTYALLLAAVIKSVLELIL
jgi:hypothetical protein